MLIAIVVAFLSGVTRTVARMANAQLSTRIGLVQSTFYNYLVGLVCYVRWRQVGRHIGLYEGFQPTGLPVVELASAVYRVEHGAIVEYWIQIDRAGLQAQLERNAQAGGVLL